MSRLRKYAALIAAIGATLGPVSAAVITNLDDNPARPSEMPDPASASGTPIVRDQGQSSSEDDPAFCTDALDSVLDFTEEHRRAAEELAEPGDADFQIASNVVIEACQNPERLLEDVIEP
jgi:hypothetical protein